MHHVMYLFLFVSRVRCAHAAPNCFKHCSIRHFSYNKCAKTASSDSFRSPGKRASNVPRCTISMSDQINTYPVLRLIHQNPPSHLLCRFFPTSVFFFLLASPLSSPISACSFSPPPFSLPSLSFFPLSPSSSFLNLPPPSRPPPFRVAFHTSSE